MMKSSENYPQLDSLIGGWFHQDFDLEGSTLEEIVAAYRQVHSSSDRGSARADILRFLEERDDAQIRDDFLQFFQPGVDPEAWGMNTRQWLLRIAELLQ